MGDYQYIARKAIAVLFILVFMNSLFLIFSPEVYIIPQTLVPIAFLSAILGIDISIRTVSSKQDRYTSKIKGLAFLSLPLVITLPYYEWQYLTSIHLSGLAGVILPVGVIVLMMGSIILIAARVQIGRYGGSKITIEDDHQLVTHGLYGTIRNPQYLGLLLIFFGYSLSFISFIVTLITVTGLFLIFRSRMELEERILIETFGEKYAEYLRRTSRLIPHVY
ncbi:MAG: methyltransferase family protein [Candidatus Thorarchaeota archaeon SMTZ1-83]|nr:MAG: hypothetical protein AM324_16675 [Candidatus Thorarchaeota archaeon SMTZ1-83]